MEYEQVLKSDLIHIRDGRTEKTICDLKVAECDQKPDENRTYKSCQNCFRELIDHNTILEIENNFLFR